jgi:xanthosine utilization system XapX-like protein
MAYTTPRTWTNGETVTAALMNTHLRDNLTAIVAANPLVVPAARVYNNADITVANNTETTLTFNSETFDTDTIHDNSTNPERLTCKTAGIYLVYANIQFATDADGVRQVIFYVNGTTDSFAYQSLQARSAGPTHVALVGVYSLAVNDYVICRVQHTAGNNLAISAPGLQHSPVFGMSYIGKAS